ncbi:MAG: fumarylacetoacetate hydrolase family protein [Caldilineaceae bacterium]
MSRYYLTRHAAPSSASGDARWALNGRYLPANVNLSLLMELPQSALAGVLDALPLGDAADAPALAPVEAGQEIWASGVTYLRSRQARESESSVADVYQRVYEAERPEIFMKAAGWRAVGSGAQFRIRKDSQWNVPEPELVLVINRHGEIIGYTAGNDASSRDIEGENPLYLPQAKVYNQSCVVGPGILLAEVEALADVPISLEIRRGGSAVFEGETSTSNMKRGFQELADYLFMEVDFPHGALLMTGTGIVPGDDFTLQPGDMVRITVGELTIENETAQ